MSTKIFLSSTFTDLEQHRAALLTVLKGVDCENLAMEFFGALPDTPKQECLRMVRDSNVYIGVYGMRYGSLDSETGKSLTQLEYEEATNSKIPRLIYIIDEERHPIFPKYMDVGEQAQKLSEFKAALKRDHVVSFFSSPDDLVHKVYADLSRTLAELAEVPTAKLLAQLASTRIIRHPLTKPRFEYLKSLVSKHLRDVPDPVLQEALELSIRGEKLGASLTLVRGAGISLDDAVDGLMQVDISLKELMAKYGAKHSSK